MCAEIIVGYITSASFLDKVYSRIWTRIHNKSGQEFGKSNMHRVDIYWHWWRGRRCAWRRWHRCRSVSWGSVVVKALVAGPGWPAPGRNSTACSLLIQLTRRLQLALSLYAVLSQTPIHSATCTQQPFMTQDSQVTNRLSDESPELRLNRQRNYMKFGPGQQKQRVSSWSTGYCWNSTGSICYGLVLQLAA